MNDNLPISEPILNNSIFIEGLGNGYYYSLNYERLFYTINNSALNIRLGYSFFPHRHDYINAIPLLINFQNKITGKSVFEAGIGARYTFSLYRKWDGYYPYKYVNTVDIIGSLGVRFLLQKHFFIKTAFTPAIIYNKKNTYTDDAALVCQFFSISMGYSWGKGKEKKD